MAMKRDKALPKKLTTPVDTTPPASLPSLKLMEAANRLLGEANAMDSNEIVTLIDSFPKADLEQQWEIVDVLRRRWSPVVLRRFLFDPLCCSMA